jgi:hypothetical protein
MSPIRGSSRGNPVWLLWLIWGVTFAFLGFVVGAWFWMQRPVQFEEHDVYGTWVSDGPHPTTLEFKQGGVVTITGSPLPDGNSDISPALIGKSEWQYFADQRAPSVVVGGTQSQSIYAENGWFSTDLVLYIDDPDLPGSGVVFAHTSGPN